MAINFYSSISLNKNELQNAVVQNAGSDPGSPAAGQIYYNSGDNTLRFYNGSSFQTLSTTTGDITGVTAGTGLTGGGSSGSVTLNVIGGDGITANANDVAITAAQTTITSVLNTSLALGRDADNQIKFGTDNQIIFRVGAGDGVIFKASGEIEATSLDISGDVDVDGTLEADAITLNGTALGALATLNTVSRTEIDADAITSGELADDAVSEEHLDVTAVTGHTDLGANFASGDSFIVHDTSVSALREGTVGNLQTYMQNNLTFTTNTDVDVSNANLLTRLAALESAGGAADQNIVIGTDSGDTIVITGNLQVQGTTTTVDSTTVTIGDHNIVLDADNSTSAVVNGAGITIEGGSGDDATFTYSTTGPKFELKLGSSYEDLQVDQLIAASLDISGNVDVDGTLETDALTIGGAAVLAQATTSAVGAVELATSAETQTGTSTTRAVTPDGLAARHVVADIDVSSLTDANIVTITHNLGTADIMVQVYDKTTEANIMCDIARTTDDFATASTSVVSIDFGTAPPNDCRALITSLKGATASGTVAYT